MFEGEQGLTGESYVFIDEESLGVQPVARIEKIATQIRKLYEQLGKEKVINLFQKKGIIVSIHKSYKEGEADLIDIKTENKLFEITSHADHDTEARIVTQLSLRTSHSPVVRLSANTDEEAGEAFKTIRYSEEFQLLAVKSMLRKLEAEVEDLVRKAPGLETTNF